METRGVLFNDLRIVQTFLALKPQTIRNSAGGDVGHTAEGHRLVRIAGKARIFALNPNPPASDSNARFELNQANDLVTKSLQVFPNAKPLHKTLLNGLAVEQFYRTRGTDVNTITQKNRCVFKIIADRADGEGTVTESVYVGIGDTADEAGINALNRVLEELRKAYYFSTRNCTSGSVCQSTVSSRR